MGGVIAKASAFVLATGGLLAAGVGPAVSADVDNTCVQGDICFYYNSNGMGAKKAFVSLTGGGTSEFDHAGYTFGGGSTGWNNSTSGTGATAGSGQALKNNAASVWNYNSAGSQIDLWVDYNSGCPGDIEQRVYANTTQGTNLNSSLKNENACHMVIYTP